MVLIELPFHNYTMFYLLFFSLLILLLSFQFNSNYNSLAFHDSTTQLIYRRIIIVNKCSNVKYIKPTFLSEFGCFPVNRSFYLPYFIQSMIIVTSFILYHLIVYITIYHFTMLTLVKRTVNYLIMLLLVSFPNIRINFLIFWL